MTLLLIFLLLGGMAVVVLQELNARSEVRERKARMDADFIHQALKDERNQASSARWKDFSRIDRGTHDEA